MTVLAPISFGRVLGMWSLHPISAVVSGVLLAAYLAGAFVVRRRREPWPAARILSWALGVAALVLTTQSGIAIYGDDLFWMHMVAHLLLVMAVPLLLIYGRPLDLLLALAGRREGSVRAVLRGRVLSVLTFPLLTLGLYTVVIAGTHLTNFMNAEMQHTWLRSAETFVYVFAGFLFFAPLVSDTPLRWQLSQPMRMMLLVVAMPVDTFTGVILGQTDSYPWPAMAAMHQSWAPSLIDDLHYGGAVMWIGGDAIMAILMGIAAIAWANAAGNGESSELGGWLSAARVNYLQTATAGGRLSHDSGPAGAVARTGDGEDDLADYNAYLARLNQRR